MVLTILLLLKILLFIYLTRVEYNHFLIFLVSSLITLFVFSLIYLSNNKKKQTLAFTFYNIMSAFMFADALYYHYFNGLPSIIMVKQLGFVAAVGDSVKSIINPLNILFLADIPFLCIYSKHKKKKIKEEGKVYSKKYRIGIPSAIAAVTVITFVVLHSLGYGTVISSQELYTYHFNDFINLFKSDTEVATGEGIYSNEDLKLLRGNNVEENRKHHGIGKGKNLIVLQVEALQNFVINEFYDGQEVTPNLNKLVKENGTIYFDKYYQSVGRGSTSDAEFVTNNSLYPSMKDPSYQQYKDNTFYGLPWILRDEGYKSWAFHGYKPEFWDRDKAYPKQGFERYVNENDFDVGEVVGLGIKDEDFFEQTIPYLKEMGEPFHAFIITLTSHTPFDMPEKYHVLDIREEHKDTMFGNYLQAIHYTDKAIGKFIEDLKKEGLYDDTVIALYGDHFALACMDEENEKVMTDYLGHQYDFDEMMNIPLMIHVPGEDINETVSTVGGQIDFLPTILNIMGIENEKGIMFGIDLLNSTDSLVAQQIHMLKGSYFDNEKQFVMSRDGIYEHSRAHLLDSRDEVDLEECRENYERALKEIDFSNYILDNDLIEELVYGSGDISTKNKNEQKAESDVENMDYIALGGGYIDGIAHTNSKEALDKSYKDGFRMIEVDIEWTNDEKLVLLENWEDALADLFSVPKKQYSYEEFKKLDMKNGLTQMTIEDLIQWMEEHEDAYILTNIKKDNVKALKYIKENHPEIQDRIVPQIYYMGAHYPVSCLGYENIVFNLTLDNYSDEEILDFVNIYDHFGAIIPKSRAEGDLPKKLEEEGLKVYVHNINDKNEKKELEKEDVFGICTETLKP